MPTKLLSRKYIGSTASSTLPSAPPPPFLPHPRRQWKHCVSGITHTNTHTHMHTCTHSLAGAINTIIVRSVRCTWSRTLTYVCAPVCVCVYAWMMRSRPTRRPRLSPHNLQFTQGKHTHTHSHTAGVFVRAYRVCANTHTQPLTHTHSHIHVEENFTRPALVVRVGAVEKGGRWWLVCGDVTRMGRRGGCRKMRLCSLLTLQQSGRRSPCFRI